MERLGVGEVWRGATGREAKKTCRHWQILSTAVLLLATLLRVWWLADVPPGLAQDEVLNADIVTFIRGGEHALFFRHGFGHEPLYHYYAVPFQILFGDNLLSIRLPAVYLGLLLVAVTMRWAKRDFGTIPAVVAGVGLAVSWWPIIFSRVGLRPIMEPLLLVGMAWFWKRPYLAGLFLGLSFYTYTSARVVLFIPLAVMGIRWVFEQLTITNVASQLFARGSGIRDQGSAISQSTNQPISQLPNYPITNYQLLKTSLISIIIALPMQITLWRDPTLQQRVNQLSGPIDALMKGEVGPIVQTAFATLGVFSFTGDPRWTYMVPERPLFDPISSLFFYMGLGWLLWKIWKPQHLLLIVWFFVALIPSAVTPQSPSTIRIIGALPLVYLMVGIGVEQVGKGLSKWLTGQILKTAVFALGALLLLGLNLNRTIQLGFIEWPQSSETQSKYQTILLNMSRYLQQFPSERPPVVADSFFEPIDADSLRRNLGQDPQARWVQLAPNAGALVWPNGQPTRLFVPEFSPIPTEISQQVGFAAEPIFRSDHSPSFAVHQLPSPVYTAVEPPQTFNNSITLVGVDMGPIVEGEAIEIFTYWQVDSRLPWDLTAFVHVLGDEPQPVTQHDGFDVAAEQLLSNDLVLQRHSLVLPENLERPYDIHIGMYIGSTGERLQIDANSAQTFLFKTDYIFDGNGGDE